MTIPFFALGKDFEPGKVLENVSILDIAPTICKAFDLNADQMEGKSLL